MQLIDLAPTLCAYLRIHCSSTGNDRNILEHSYAEAFTLWNFWIAVRDESWKLIYHISTQQAQLYDLASDPTEQRNRAQSDPETLARLLAKKDELLEALRDAAPRGRGRRGLGVEADDRVDLVAELLELAGNAARDNKKARIVPRHIQLAVKNDTEFNNYLGKATIVAGGVVPNIHQALSKAKKQ